MFNFSLSELPFSNCNLKNYCKNAGHTWIVSAVLHSLRTVISTLDIRNAGILTENQSSLFIYYMNEHWFSWVIAY